MYSERITQSPCNVQNDNNMSCAKCAYKWIENRGLPPDRLVCPRCGSKVVRRGLVQSGNSNRPSTSAISELMDILEFTTGERIDQVHVGGYGR